MKAAIADFLVEWFAFAIWAALWLWFWYGLVCLTVILSRAAWL